MTRKHEIVPQIDYAIIDRLKPLALKLCERFDGKVPIPRDGNMTENRNLKNVIEIRDWFFQHLDCPSREKGLRGMFNWAILHMNDRPYRLWFMALLQEAMKKNWDFSEGKPYYWKEETSHAVQGQGQRGLPQEGGPVG